MMSADNLTGDAVRFSGFKSRETDADSRKSTKKSESRGFN